MKPSFNSDESVLIRTRLVYARWLYDKGVREMHSGARFDGFSAITLFHTAVEATLNNIVLAHDFISSPQKRPETIAQLIEAVDRKGGSAPQAPLVPCRKQLLRLAKARNDILHHGLRLHADEVEVARRTCRQFLIEAARGFLFEDIDTVSVIDLVEASEDRAVLAEAAKRQLLKENIHATALAYYSVERSLDAVALWLHGRPGRAERRLGILGRAVEEEIGGGSRFKDLIKEIERFMNETSQRERWSLLSVLGIEAGAIARFHSIPLTVNCQYADRGSPLRASHYTSELVTDADAEYALAFAVDLALKAQAVCSTEQRVPRRTMMGHWTQYEFEVPRTGLEEQSGPAPKSEKRDGASEEGAEAD